MLTDGRTDGKADAYIAPCYKQVRQKAESSKVDVKTKTDDTVKWI